MNKPLITAHTGCDNTPHNTIESVFSGQEYGADINEVDVRVTKDGIPVLWHDSGIETSDGQIFPVDSITYPEIEDLQSRKDLKFPDNQTRITKLEEVFDAIKDGEIFLNLDLKTDTSIDPVIKLTREWNLTERVVFSGCEEGRAALLKKKYPEFQVLLNADEKLLAREDLSYVEKVKILCDTAVSSSCCGLNVPYEFCRPELIKYADLRLLPVAVWTVSSEDLLQKFIDMGVFSITTYNVKKLAEMKQL